MGRRAKTGTYVKRPPARTPEAQENRMISLAMDLAEKQLMEGTASSQVITHYLKLGSTRERLEREFLQKQMTNLEAKTEALQAAKEQDSLYLEAIEALKAYKVNDNAED